MIEIYKKELEDKLKNVEINTKIVHFHNIKKDELILMYKNFNQTNNLSYIDFKDIEVDNISFSIYEDWLVRFNDY